MDKAKDYELSILSTELYVTEIPPIRLCFRRKHNVYLGLTNMNQSLRCIFAEASLIYQRNVQPVPLIVKLQQETLVYSFLWKIREGVVKDFVALANKPGMTHQTLQERYNEMVCSNYSY